MRKLILTTFILSFFGSLTFGQRLTQTVRGTILDTDSKTPLIGAVVVIVGSDPLIGTTTDVEGKFRLENVPTGRVTLQLSYLGYENATIPNIEVNSGKESVLNLHMQESVVKMDELVIKANEKKGEAVNDMSLLSARSISVEESKRFAGSFNDPSRVVSNYAGVASTPDGSSDIIVRGNSPKYIQWRLEGMEISSPYHFNDQNASSGGLSVINNNLLATSDFYTGAFSPEYGNVLSGVMDVKLRAGNNEKFESSFGYGLIGADLTLEGPFKKGYDGSYLVNYRYSTGSLIDELGLIDVGGIPKFQDAAFKVMLPTKNAGNFSLFGLGGFSSFLIEDVTPDVWKTPGDNATSSEVVEDYDKIAFMLNGGMRHTLTIGNSSFIQTSLSYSGDGIEDDVFETRTTKLYDGNGEFLRNDVSDRTLNFKSRLNQTTYRGAVKYSNKINARNKVQIGSKYALFDYSFRQSRLENDFTTRVPLVDFDENIGTLNNFISWKHRINENVTLVSGVHNMHVFFNDKSTIEPRFAVNWKLNEANSVHAGYGNHSNMERIHNYFAQVQRPDGSVAEPNRNLDLLRAHHFVVGYEKRFTENLMTKVEVYYQDLYNLPVENNDTSYYATINEGVDYRYVDLVNEGKGKNYGVELTLERFLANNYYFLVNGSLFESTYEALEGIERNTQYNGNYIVNILLGKEFVNLGRKENQTLALNTKIFYGGGKKYIPLLRDDRGNLAVDPANNRFFDYDKAYEDKIDNIFQLDLSASYKFSRPKATHEIFMNIFNLTNSLNRISEFYDNSEPEGIGYVTQFGAFPNLMYRVYF